MRTVLFSWVMLSMVVGVAAASRGRNAAWLFLALVISPLVAACPGDDSTVSETRSSGSDLSLSAPGFGVIMHSTGLALPDGTRHGISAQFPLTPEVAAALCAALTT